MQRIMLPDEDAEIDPVPGTGGGHHAEPELDRLSNILRTFNEHFGDIHWEDADRVRQLIIETIPTRVAVDTAFRNAQRNSDRQNARIEHDKALLRVMTAVMRDDTELFKQFMDNTSFKRWMTDTVFDLAYEPPATPPSSQLRCSKCNDGNEIEAGSVSSTPWPVVASRRARFNMELSCNHQIK